MPVGQDDLVARYLQRVQTSLERQNGVDRQASVLDFLIDTEHRAGLPGANPAIAEQIFVTDGADLGMAVYIAEDVLARVAQQEQEVDLKNRPLLDDYCVAAEGVSHFVYLVERAHRDRTVTLLELELQAEVDKFVHLTYRLGLAPGSDGQAKLISQLFENYELRDNLSRDEAQRYHHASKVAAKFCHRLKDRAKRAQTHAVMLEDARDFFDLPLEGKLRRSNGLF